MKKIIFFYILFYPLVHISSQTENLWNYPREGEEFLYATCLLSCDTLLEQTEMPIIKIKNTLTDSLYCVFENHTLDTIYLYGTTYIQNFVYNEKIIKYRRHRVFIDLSVKVPHPYTIYSGFVQYQLFTIPPHYCQKMSFDIDKIIKETDTSKIDNIVIKLSYFDYVRIVERDEKGNILAGWRKPPTTIYSKFVYYKSNEQK